MGLLLGLLSVDDSDANGSGSVGGDPSLTRPPGGRPPVGATGVDWPGGRKTFGRGPPPPLSERLGETEGAPCPSDEPVADATGAEPELELLEGTPPVFALS